MPGLFDPIQIRGLQIANRVGVSPMCQYSSEDGFANDWHFVHLASRAVGGAGIVFTEAAAVSPEGRISPQDLGIWKDDHIPALRRIANFIRGQGSVPGIQIAHAGRKASTARPWEGGAALTPEQGAWEPLAPSVIPFSSTYPQPRELTIDEIRSITASFVAAAVRARNAGFQIVELHAAHGYLLHEFLSPLSNQRTDSYGGSFENRTRLVREIAAAVRAAWPQTLPLFVRISATDWTPGGWDLEQSVELSRALQELGVDVIDCSSGGNVATAQIPLGPGYQTPFAERIRRDTGLLTAAVGLITSPQQAAHIVQSGQADIVLLAREMLRDPYWPLRAARELGAKIAWPIQYARSGPSGSPTRP